MNRLAPLMSSAKSDWCTPLEVLRRVRDVAVDGGIQLDPCTTPDNPVGARVICVHPKDWTPGVGALSYPDGLAQDWAALTGEGLVFVNPPYGRLIGDWVDKCRNVADEHPELSVIALLPARPDTRWWHRHCAPPESQAVCFWRGRLTFVGAEHPAPFPSCLTYWGPRKYRFAEVFAPHGSIWL